MKGRLGSLAGCLLLAALGLARADIQIDPDPKDETLEPYTSLTIHFPKDLVPPEQIDAAKAQSPIIATPPLNGQFIWRTQSQGVWSVDGPRIPGTTYRFTLRPDLRDLEGNPLAGADWHADYSTNPLRVDADYGERERLSAQPQVPLEFNFLIHLPSVPEGAWIQDRATRQRFPVEVMLNRPAAEDLTGAVEEVKLPELPASLEFRVRPREPLPVGRMYDLVVDGVTDAHGGKTLPYPRVFPLGRTRPLEVDYVAARNWPTDQPKIEVKFRTPIPDAALPAGSIQVTPAVPGLHFRVADECVFLEGKF
ncbi:MAG TPA: Ig-like domain-containing protein, partial [Chthoniobacterales bacterium]